MICDFVGAVDKCGGLAHTPRCCVGRDVEGWARQQRVRFLNFKTIRRRLELVRLLVAFSNQYSWEWTAAQA